MKHQRKVGRPPNHPPVMLVDTGEIFETYTAAAKAINGDRTNVKRVACGVQAHHKGHRFIFCQKTQ